jgi:hypothetical protein
VSATFIITLREAFEAALIPGIVYSYLDKIGARDGYRYLTRGGVLGLLASVGMGIGVSYLSGPLLDVGPDLITVAVIFTAVGLLTWHAWWMQQHARLIRGEVQDRIDEARAANRLWVVGLIAFTACSGGCGDRPLANRRSRDWRLRRRRLGRAAAIGWAIFRGGRHLSLQRSSRHYLHHASGRRSPQRRNRPAAGHGTAAAVRPLWNTSWPWGSSVAGGFPGLVGYRSQPTLPEACAYVAYVSSWLPFCRRAGDRVWRT